MGRGDTVVVRSQREVVAVRARCLVLSVCVVVAGSLFGAPSVLANDDPATAAVPAQADEVGEYVVDVDDNFFKPKKLKVEVGDTVTWEWVGSVVHNVVVTKGPKKFKSKIQSEGTFERTIKKPGKYQIVCTLHPGMEMKLIAKKPAPPPSTTLAPS